MKKLLLTMGCITAIVLMSSCTTDGIEDIKNTKNNNNSKTISGEVLGSIEVPNSNSLETGDTDKDKTKT